MTRVLSQPAAEVVLVLDAAGSATLTELATATGRAVSTVQRAAESLTRANVLERTDARGPLRIAQTAPRRALRDIARWQVGKQRRNELATAAAYVERGGRSLPATVKRREIRRSLPVAVGRIVDRFDPVRVVLFGSQARGDTDRHSDVDLLVVFADERDQRARRIAIRRLMSDMPFAKDVLVASSERYSHPLPGTAVKSAVAEGVTLYAR